MQHHNLSYAIFPQTTYIITQFMLCSGPLFSFHQEKPFYKNIPKQNILKTYDNIHWNILYYLQPGNLFDRVFLQLLPILLSYCPLTFPSKISFWLRKLCFQLEYDLCLQWCKPETSLLGVPAHLVQLCAKICERETSVFLLRGKHRTVTTKSFFFLKS